MLSTAPCNRPHAAEDYHHQQLDRCHARISGLTKPNWQAAREPAKSCKRAGENEGAELITKDRIAERTHAAPRSSYARERATERRGRSRLKKQIHEINISSVK